MLTFTVQQLKFQKKLWTLIMKVSFGINKFGFRSLVNWQPRPSATLKLHLYSIHSAPPSKILAVHTPTVSMTSLRWYHFEWSVLLTSNSSILFSGFQPVTSFNSGWLLALRGNADSWSPFSVWQDDEWKNLLVNQISRGLWISRRFPPKLFLKVNEFSCALSPLLTNCAADDSIFALNRGSPRL